MTGESTPRSSRPWPPPDGSVPSTRTCRTSPNRNAEGREIRSAFVPGEGYESLLSSDYSQVELRIMADLSGDDALIEAFRPGADFHKYVASLVYGIPVDDITPDQRTHVKAMSYGLAYGLSTYGLAQQLKISPGEADRLKSQYFATFGKVHEYLESLVAGAREKGYTETMFGRRRYFPDCSRRTATYATPPSGGALNAPIQGSAADIMKIAMIHASDALAKAKVRSRIILQIHDELVVEIAPRRSRAGDGPGARRHGARGRSRRPCRWTCPPASAPTGSSPPTDGDGTAARTTTARKEKEDKP